MDIIAKIDRTLLDNELRNLVRFRMSRDSDRDLFKPTLFLYAFCHWLFHLFLADLDANNRTKIKETLDD